LLSASRVQSRSGETRRGNSLIPGVSRGNRALVGVAGLSVRTDDCRRSDGKFQRGLLLKMARNPRFGFWNAASVGHGEIAL